MCLYQNLFIIITTIINMFLCHYNRCLCISYQHFYVKVSQCSSKLCNNHSLNSWEIVMLNIPWLWPSSMHIFKFSIFNLQDIEGLRVLHHLVWVLVAIFLTAWFLRNITHQLQLPHHAAVLSASSWQMVACRCNVDWHPLRHHAANRNNSLYICNKFSENYYLVSVFLVNTRHYCARRQLLRRHVRCDCLVCDVASNSCITIQAVSGALLQRGVNVISIDHDMVLSSTPSYFRISCSVK